MSTQNRKARKQANKAYDDNYGGQGDSSHVNIWYGPSKRGRGKEKAQAKCNVSDDTGVTRGSEAKAREFCLYFARGACCRGYDCHKLHFVPGEEDDLRSDNAVDCFGRERGRDEGSDQDGIGCMFKENRTLWVGGLPLGGGPQKEVEKRLTEVFSPYGPITSVRMVSNKGCAFVQYRYRASAEFAREATANQVFPTAANGGSGGGSGAGGGGSGGGRGQVAMRQKEEEGPVLHVKWATEDPNPRAIMLDTQRKAQTLLAAKIAKGEASADLYAAVPKRDRMLLKRQKLDGQQQEQQQQSYLEQPQLYSDYATPYASYPSGYSQYHNSNGPTAAAAAATTWGAGGPALQMGEACLDPSANYPDTSAQYEQAQGPCYHQGNHTAPYQYQHMNGYDQANGVHVHEQQQYQYQHYQHHASVGAHSVMCGEGGDINGGGGSGTGGGSGAATTATGGSGGGSSVDTAQQVAEEAKQSKHDESGSSLSLLGVSYDSD